MYYYPVIPRLLRIFLSAKGRELICQGIQGHQLDSFDGIMRDCLDGASARFALQGIRDKHSNEDYQVIPILLAASYDGLQVHKHRANNAWILCVTILNLPPNMRYTLGVGTFIVAIIPCLVGSQAEEQVLSLLVDELLLLDRGLLVENPEVRDQRCLVTARLVQQIFDTKALQKVLQVQGPGARSGCAICRCIAGQYRHILSKTVHLGHRALLPADHVLRRVGQARSCCPENFYGSASNVHDIVIRDRCKEIAAMAVRNNPAHGHDQGLAPQECPHQQLTVPTTEISCEGVPFTTALAAGNRAFWSHAARFSFQTYSPHVDFPSLDARVVRVPRQARIDTSDSGAAQPIRDDFYETYPEFKKAWIFQPLDYAHVLRSVTYDAMHCISNVAGLVLDIVLGEICTQPADLTLARAQGIHRNWPSSGFSRGAPWRFLVRPPAISRRLDCILLPAAFASYRIRKFDTERGHLTSHHRLLLLTVYWKYISHDNLGRAFRALFCQLSDDIVELLRPSIREDSIPTLQLLVAETIALWEGMLPESSMRFALHQLVDIAASIRHFGPLRSGWMYPYERVMKVVRGFWPHTGGRSNDLTAAGRYEALEASTFNQTFERSEAAEVSACQVNVHESPFSRPLNREATIFEGLGLTATDSLFAAYQFTYGTSAELQVEAHCHESVISNDQLLRYLTSSPRWRSCFVRCKGSTGSDPDFYATVNAFVLTSAQEHFAVVQQWKTIIVGAEGGTDAEACGYHAICLSSSSTRSLRRVACAHIWETAVAIAPLLFRGGETMRAVMLEGIDDHHVEPPTHLGLIDLQPQNVGLSETRPCRADDGDVSTINLTFRQLLRCVERKQFDILPRHQGPNGAIRVGDFVAFKYSTGWALGSVVCAANDTDIRKGCTHDVRFDDGIDACKLETDNQVDTTFATNQREMPGVWMFCTR